MSGYHFLDLPADILTEIFKLLRLKDLSNLMLTCSELRDFIAENCSLWKYFTRHDLVIEDRKVADYADFDRYNASRISYNWRQGIYESKQLINMRARYMPWIKYTPDVLLLSVGSELRCYHVNRYGMPSWWRTLWRLTVPRFKRYDIRTNDISRFVMKDNMIVCGYRDGAINVYQIDKLKKEPKLLQNITNCHEDGLVEVSTVDVIHNSGKAYVITGSEKSKQVIVWRWAGDSDRLDETSQLEKYEELTLPGYRGARILALNECGSMLAVGPEGDDRPVFTDINTMTVLRHVNRRMRQDMIRDVQWHDKNTLAYVSHGGIVGLMDARIQEVVYEKMDPFHSPLYCVKTDGNNALVVGSAQYSRCVLYDRRRQTGHVQMYFTQKQRSPVYGLDFRLSKLLAAIDRSVGILDFNVCAQHNERKDFSSYVFIPDDD